MSKSNKVSQLFSVKKIAIPIILGLVAAVYMLYANTDWDEFEKFSWELRSFVWMFGGLFMMGLRDLGYMYRIKVLTDGQINW